MPDDLLVVVPHHALVGRIGNLMERLAVLEVAVLGYLYNAAPPRRELGMQSRLVTDLRRRPHLETVPLRTVAAGAHLADASARDPGADGTTGVLFVPRCATAVSPNG